MSIRSSEVQCGKYVNTVIHIREEEPDDGDGIIRIFVNPGTDRQLKNIHIVCQEVGDYGSVFKGTNVEFNLGQTVKEICDKNNLIPPEEMARLKKDLE